MLAIIPARGGSKGLVGKNIKELLGKPLIVYAVEAAKKAKHISRIIVSTDDQKIADLAVAAGAECPFMRPTELASDEAKAIDTYTYTIDRLNEEGADIKEFVVLQATSPLRTAEDIDACIELYRKKKADSVVSYTEEAHPISWHKYIDKEGKISPVFEDDKANRQEYKKTYHPNGAVYVFNYEMIKRGEYYTENSFAYLMPRLQSIDIDTLEDFEYAAFLLSRK